MAWATSTPVMPLYPSKAGDSRRAIGSVRYGFSRFPKVAVAPNQTRREMNMSSRKNNRKSMARRVGVVMVQAAFAVLASSAYAEEGNKMFSLSGFGTFGLTHSSLDKGDYVADVFTRSGAGRSSNWSTNVDTKAAVQLDAKFNDQLSAVVQIIAKPRPDNSYTPRLEWANIKYAITPDLSVRIGRTVLPTFMTSDTRLVGYANPWIRPQQETYRLISFTNSDGIDISYHTNFGALKNTVQVWAGSTKVDIVSSNNTVSAGLKGEKIRGISDTIEYGALTARISTTSADYKFVGRAAIPVKVVNIGAIYDPGNWFVQGEVSHYNAASSLRAQLAWNITAGYRWNDFTPYIGYSSIKANDDQVKLALRAQNSTSLGLRWDFRKNMDLKVQFDHLKLQSGSNGFFANVQPGLAGKSTNVTSIALDYTF